MSLILFIKKNIFMATSDIKINAQNPIASTDAVAELIKKIHQEFQQDELTELTYAEFQSYLNSAKNEPGHLYKVMVDVSNIPSLPEKVKYIIFSFGGRGGCFNMCYFGYTSTGTLTTIGLQNGQRSDFIDVKWIDVDVSIPKDDIKNALKGNSKLV